MVAAITETKDCMTCGQETTHEIPADLKPAYRNLLKRLGVECDDCAAATELREESEAKLRRAEQAAARYGNRVLQSGVPDQLRSVTFDDLDVDDGNATAIDAAQRWGRGELSGLLLAGPVGVGKTYAAAAAVNARLRREKVRWFSVSRLLVQATAGFGTDARRAATEVLLDERLALALDDIDKVSPTDYARGLLFEAIDERVNAGAPLLITTNLGYAALVEVYGEPIASRLRGYCEPHRIEGEDRRTP